MQQRGPAQRKLPGRGGTDMGGMGKYVKFMVGCMLDCPLAYLPSNRQEVENGQAYTLYTPQVPVLSSYQFVGWKNVITGEMYPASGTFSGENSVYLEAVWIVYGPSV